MPVAFIDAAMESVNSSSARLSHLTYCQVSAIATREQLGTSSSRVDHGGLDTLPQAKIQALESFVKFPQAQHQSILTPRALQRERTPVY